MVAGPDIRTRAMVVQQKTGRPVQFEITSDVRASLLAWLERRGGIVEDYAFPSRIDHAHHMSTRQYARLVDEWVTAIGLRPEEYGTHSLRRTKASMIYKATGNIRAIRSCSATPRLRTLSDISVSTWRTRCSWQSGPKSDVARSSDAARMTASTRGKPCCPVHHRVVSGLRCRVGPSGSLDPLGPVFVHEPG